MRIVTTASLFGVIVFFFTGAVFGQGCPKASRAAAQLLDIQAGGHFESGELRQALDKWEQAYEKCPNSITAWNIARSYEEMREHAKAKEAFRLFLSMPDLSPEEIAGGQKKILSLEILISTFERHDLMSREALESGDHTGCIDAATSALEITRSINTQTRLATCQRSAGRVGEAIETLETLAASGRLDKEGLAQLHSELNKLKEELAAARSGPLPETSEDPVIEELTGVGRFMTWSYVTAGVAVVAGGAALTIFLLNRDTPSEALALKNKIEASGVGCQGNPDCLQFESLKDDIETANLTLGVSLTIGAAALATSALLFFIDEEPNASGGLRLFVSPAGLGLAGTF